MDILLRRSFLAQAEAFLERNEPREALNLANARLKSAPGDLDARIVICRVRLLQGKLAEGRELLNEMEEILGSFSQIYACIGDICMKKGMQETAEDFYRKFLSLNPGLPLSPGVAEGLNGSEALDAADDEEAMEGDAAIPAGFETVTLAELYLRQGHLRQAEELLCRIIGQDPRNEKAAALLQELRQQSEEGSVLQQHAGVIAELSRWLENVGRLRLHAA